MGNGQMTITIKAVNFSGDAANQANAASSLKPGVLDPSCGRY